MKIVLRIGSEWFNWIIVANRKLSLGRNMDQQYKQEVKYGQNGLQRVLSIIAFLADFAWQQWYFWVPYKQTFLHAGSYFPLWSIPQRAPSETWKQKKRHAFCLHYLFSAVCDELILWVTGYHKTCLYITNSWFNTRYAICWWAQGCTNSGSKSLWRINFYGGA